MRRSSSFGDAVPAARPDQRGGKWRTPSVSSRRVQSQTNYAPGQRWSSLTEPELGLGVVEVVDGRQVVIGFPAREVIRRYEMSEAPLTRARLSEGQVAKDLHGNSLRVESVSVEDDILVYRGEGRELRETDLDPRLDVATPENRLRSAEVDPHPLFDLRREALDIQNHMLASPARGFLGGRIRLFDHQLSIARDVCDRHRVRVLLADEVGLGKTIEALLILNRMLLTGRIERVLVMVPPALVHQWLAEAFLKFNLLFRVIGQDSLDSQLLSPDDDSIAAQLSGSRLCICPLGERAAALESEDFDLLVVDEAHHLVPRSSALAQVERLAGNIDHVVLLSATPDRDGEEAHFRRLALLDPGRFHDFDAYQEEAASYADLADTAERLQSGDALTADDRRRLAERLVAPDVEALIARSESDPDARRELLRRLLDLHGIGRVMFRNVRARIPGFPQRIPVPAILEVSAADKAAASLRAELLADMGRGAPVAMRSAKGDPRCAWLRDFLDANPDQRVLALCSTKDKVEAFADTLETRTRKVARFHEKMTSIQRDRQAAWFLAPDGPQLLISSAIGAEGRNFQVARHLVLLDLPPTPDRLEQLIGRIDRIGQGAEVYLHAPVVAGTAQARLLRWYESLGIFRGPWHGAPAIEREFGEAVLDAACDPGEAGERALDALIERGRARNEEIIVQLEGGRDRLLELTSFDLDAARRLAKAIAHSQDDLRLQNFMLLAFERAGLNVERTGHRSYGLIAGEDYNRPFPGFVGEEMGVTFDRDLGIEHPERTLLTFDSPMVRDTVDNLLSHETGNACIAKFPNGPQPGVWLEAIFVAEPTVARDLRADRFFPPTPIRVVIDAQGNEVALDPDEAHDCLVACDPALLEHDSIQSLLGPLQEQARALAESRGPAIAESAREEMKRELGPAVARLEDLAQVHESSTSAEELEAARTELAALDTGLLEVRVRLDALRVILVMPGS